MWDCAPTLLKERLVPSEKMSLFHRRARDLEDLCLRQLQSQHQLLSLPHAVRNSWEPTAWWSMPFVALQSHWPATQRR